MPLHPEYRTMPMVWYIPPLSPVVDVVTGSGNDGEGARALFAAIDKLRIPVSYLAELFTAGDTAPVDESLRKLAAMRSYLRGINLDDERDESIAASVGIPGTELEEMYRLLAIAKYDNRYVIPAAHAEQARVLEELACSLDYEGGPGMGGAGPFGSSSGHPVPVAVEDFHALVSPQSADRPSSPGRVNLLNWGGNGSPDRPFPAARRQGHGDREPRPDDPPTSPGRAAAGRAAAAAGVLHGCRGVGRRPRTRPMPGSRSTCARSI